VTSRRFAATDLHARQVQQEDVEALQDFRCSGGDPCEQFVEEEIRLRLPRRFLDNAGRRDDPRLIVVCDQFEAILGLAAHRVEPLPVAERDLHPTYLEVLAVNLDARRSVVELDDGGDPLTFGEFVFELAVQDAGGRDGRDPLIFGRVDRRHTISLDFCDRVGLLFEKPNSDPQYIQRWGDL
jgi:hypothetical protein